MLCFFAEVVYLEDKAKLVIQTQKYGGESSVVSMRMPKGVLTAGWIGAITIPLFICQAGRFRRSGNRGVYVFQNR